MTSHTPKKIAQPSQPRAGEGTQIVRSLIGKAVAMQSSTWHHPWATIPFWSSLQKQWQCVVRPGFVNGKCPSVLTTADKMKQTPSFLAPITAWDGAADILQAAELAASTTTVDGTTPIYVPLYRNPMIPITGLQVCDPVPKFFSRRGIDGTTRKLFSAVVILHQPRMALTSQITTPVDLVLGTSIVTQTLGERAPAGNDRLKVFASAYMETVQTYQAGGGLMQDYEEPTWDELVIARVFLASPPNASGLPDGTWVSFVQHKLFWNLNWTQPKLAPVPDTSLPLGATASFGILAGGAGQLVINSLVASINDMTHNAVNILSANSLAGTFWTPTGGGSDATFPVTAEDAAKPSLSKSADAKAKRAAALKAGALIDTLDPQFPFNALPFSLNLLS